MLKKSIYLFVMALGFAFISCDEDDIEALIPAFDVTINETGEIPINVDQTNGNRVMFSNTMNIGIVNEDTEDHLNKIKKVTITRLRYKVLRFSGDPNGDVQGSFSADNGPEFNEAFVVNEVFQNGTYFEVSDNAELNRIAEALRSKRTIQIEYSGSALCDDQAMNFTILVELQGKVTIDP